MAEASRNRKDEQGTYPLNWFSGYVYIILSNGYLSHTCHAFFRLASAANLMTIGKWKIQLSKHGQNLPLT